MAVITWRSIRGLARASETWCGWRAKALWCRTRWAAWTSLQPSSSWVWWTIVVLPATSPPPDRVDQIAGHASSEMLAYVQPDSRSNPYHMTSISRFGRLAWRLVLVSALIVPSTVQAQTARAPPTDLPDVTRALAITNARIVQAPGQVIDRGTVVVRNGLIEAVGSRVDIPVDARIIEADTLVVYAGFIDGLSHTAIPEALATPLTYRVPTPAAPPYDRAGIQPNRVAASHYQSAYPSVSNFRGVRFPIPHAVPRARS